MLWYKSWLETRWRFVIGLAILTLSACGSVLAYPQVLKLLPLAEKVDTAGALGRLVVESAELARDYRGYIWSQWFLQNMPQQWALFAVLIGTGGLLSQASGGGALFTLSLPATRGRVLGIRAATGLAELFVLALIPSLVLPVLSPAIGQSYSAGDALLHGVCMFVAGSVFFALTVLLSTVFRDIWRPALIVLCGAVVLALFEQVFRDTSRFGLFSIMSAEAYFRGDGVPWPGLVASAAVSAAVLFAAVRNIEGTDF
jgi:hypothetical protein